MRKRGQEAPFNYEYKAHVRTFNTPEARALLFFKLITTQDIEEYKAVYRKLTNYGANNSHHKYKGSNKNLKKFLEVF